MYNSAWCSTWGGKPSATYSFLLARKATAALRLWPATRSPFVSRSVVVAAPTVSLEHRDIRAGAGTGSAGRGGVVEVRGDTVTLRGGSDISTDTNGAGAAGRVTVVATEAIRIQGGTMGSVATGSSRGDGDQVFVAAPLVSLEGVGSSMGADTSGRGKAARLRSRRRRSGSPGGRRSAVPPLVRGRGEASRCGRARRSSSSTEVSC